MTSPRTPVTTPSAGGLTDALSSGSLGRRRRRQRTVAGLVAVGVLAVGGVAVARPGSSSGGGYRTTPVAVHPVAQVLNGVATIEPVTQTSVAFPAAGRVAAVLTRVGDTVAVGQSLASLDPASLHDALDAKQAALDKAQLILAKALAGQSVSSLVGSGSGGRAAAGGGAASAGSSSGFASSAGPVTRASATPSAAAPASPAPTSAGAARSGSSSGGTGSPPGGTTSSTTVPADSGSTGGAGAGKGGLRAAQQAVLDAQHQADGDLSAAQAALASATTVCAVVGQPGPGDPGATTTTTTVPTSSTSSTSTTAGSGPTTTSASGGGSGPVDSCHTGLEAVLVTERTVATDQQAMATASMTYEQLVDQRAATLTSRPATSSPTGGSTGSSIGGSTTPGSAISSRSASGRTSPTSVTSANSRSSSSSSSSSSSASGTSGAPLANTPSAADLVRYQASVDAAGAAVAVARQAIDQTTIVSPIAGTVVSVGLAVGDAVTADSTTATITVVGQGGLEATSTVAADQLRHVKVGQSATVVPDGRTAPLDGTVVRIGMVGTTTGSATTYPVTIAFTGTAKGDQEALGNGTIASSAIVVGATGNALAVPTSAVTTDGTSHTVTVVENGSPKVITVQVSAVGQTWTAITKGLTKGQEVVLADLSAPLPGSATATQTNTQTRAGQGRTGGAGGGAGFRGGGGFGGGGAGFGGPRAGG